MAGFCRADSVGHIDKVKLHRARLVLGLVTMHFWWIFIPLFTKAIQAHTAWPSLRGLVQ